MNSPPFSLTDYPTQCFSAMLDQAYGMKGRKVAIVKILRGWVEAGDGEGFEGDDVVQMTTEPATQYVVKCAVSGGN
ncbi:hypothetical protein L6452_06466 [Arctium lappa]|uniref:Uncharacterized protein n=1 Tax=Arctium lappa TaxID=4217 RepID=A0ACB9EJX2_ARCLA|nr:hypothetical protein L6452_06466 [Arctium lappa]